MKLIFDIVLSGFSELSDRNSYPTLATHPTTI
jgi:hypothetical protein